MVATSVPMTVIFSSLSGVIQPTIAYVSAGTVFFGIYLVVFQGLLPDLSHSNKGIYILF